MNKTRRGSPKIRIDQDRMTAYKVLLKIDKSRAYSNIELNSALSDNAKARGSNSYDDAVVNPAFVRELVYGVIKNRWYLDYFIDKLARDGIEGVRREIVILLRMGLYQIVFMDSVPDHSAVDETVKVTKLLFPGRDGFVNGLLRNFIRERDAYYGKPDADLEDVNSNDAAISNVHDSESEAADLQAAKTGSDDTRYIPVPDIEDPVERMSVMYSCEPGLVRLIASQYGEEKAEEILRVSLETPPLYVSVNTLKTDTEQLIEALRTQGFGAENAYDTDLSQNCLMVSGKGILETEEFRNGMFFVQDASSSEAIRAFSPEPGEVLIDVCAAPGGKSFAAAIIMENRGVIHAMDLHGNKLRALQKQAKRLGITIIDTEEHDAKTPHEKYAVSKADSTSKELERGAGHRNDDTAAGNTDDAACGWQGADKVLCDVPCSGLGVLRRKPEIKDRELRSGGRDLAEIQYQILSSSAEYVKAGGELMYSTCTINRIENEEVTGRFLKERTDFKVCCSRLTMPCSGGPDGFYYCIMQRI